MLTLSGRVIRKSEVASDTKEPGLYSLSTNATLPSPLRDMKAFLARDSSTAPSGFKRYFALPGASLEGIPPEKITRLGPEFDYFGDGDVVSLSPDGRIRSIFRANSSHNSILLTEQCNHYCLMCSQPPKRVDDSWLLNEAFEAIKMIPRETAEIGFTGGEPTIYGGGFIKLLQHIKNWLPKTSVHVLSNGRAFADEKYAKAYAQVEHPDLMIGIPIYSADASLHDYVVQSKGAFDETVRGVINLKRYKQRVEIRVVIHKQTCDGLPELASFIARNLLFVDQVALMGLENIGFARANIDTLWVDPVEYKDQLSEAVQILTSYGIRAAVYNHPLCLVNADVFPVYVKSISDWKNEFAKECEPCRRKSECGGFFSSGIRNGYSQSLTPFL
ncbi:His-Xaa-Ser system radical SAM maturase HxsC [Neopusillimonas maritima]|uniref:His-Xaa-Ser system radical SAM maturase HxsC n=1 Tax=Neopusillimonas maritima TaxID=2026239 RepID=A0ABX9MYG5_9BURK|nr:His-Xaa-Ser system radical SAM maturase HxsC [Neopusillimonas maritima]RII84020.1 His-Xaa-Ser system radical SAM maturase HxsC [Neopusillimonas maritima]